MNAKITAQAERVARIFGLPLAPLQKQIAQEIQSLRTKKRKATRRKAPVCGLTAQDYERLINI